MIENCDGAIKKIRGFQSELREIDRLLCREQGHPDQTYNILDPHLHYQINQAQENLSALIGWIEDKKRRLVKDENK